MASDKIIRVDLGFEREIEEIIRERAKRGKENFKKVNGSRRITAAIRRHIFWPDMKQDIIIADLEDDRSKGGRRRKK